MENRIKYTLVPSDSYEDGMMQVLFTKDIVYTDMMIIDNVALGVALEPELSDMVKVCSKKDLLANMKKIVLNTGCETLILNGFDISVDEVREKYVDFAKEYDVYLCINVISDNNKVKKNITTYFDYDITDLNEEKWTTLKDEFSEAINNKVFEEESTDPLDMLKNILNGSSDMISKLDEIDDIEILEEYSYSNADGEINIKKLSDTSIVIGDDVNEVVIENTLLSFLLSSLQALI